MRIIIQGEQPEYIAQLIATALAAAEIDFINYSYKDGVEPTPGNYNRVSIETTTQPLPPYNSAPYEEQIKP